MKTSKPVVTIDKKKLEKKPFLRDEDMIREKEK
jgi:hypothetical protein